MKNNIVKWVALGTFGLGFMLHNGVVQGMTADQVNKMSRADILKKLSDVSELRKDAGVWNSISAEKRMMINGYIARGKDYVKGVSGNPPAQGFASLFDKNLSAGERLKIIAGADASKLVELRQAMTGKGVTLQELNGGALNYKGGDGSLLVDGVYKLADTSNTYLEFRLVGNRLTTKNASGNYSAPLKSPVLLELLKK